MKSFELLHQKSNCICKPEGQGTLKVGHTLVEEVLATLLHVVRVIELVCLEQQRVAVKELAILPSRGIACG